MRSIILFVCATLVALALTLVVANNRSASAQLAGTPTVAQVSYCVAPASGLVGWWAGDNNPNDIQGGHNGSLQGGATYAAGAFSQAFSLNGTDAFVQVSDSAAFDPTTAGSQEAWVYFNQLPSEAAHIMEIIGKGSSGTDFDLQADPDNRFRFYIAAGTQVASTTIIQNGVWYHVVGTWDSTIGLKLYVNGVLEGENPTLLTRSQSGQHLEIGHQPFFQGRFFNGRIDEARVYNRALTTQEVQSIYNSGSGGICKATVQFSAPTDNAGEGVGSLLVTVTRTGDTTTASSVNYTTGDSAGANNCNLTNGNASSRCDYLLTVGTLTFAAGETSKSISIPIVDDVYAEGPETFAISLSNAAGATLGSTATATITINDNDAVTGTNPIDTPDYYVRQHYVDFLNREPDVDGWTFWTNEITMCGTDPQCIEVKRINVSAAFYLSIEFQESGYLVYRIYKTAFGNLAGAPVPVQFTEFLRDTQQIGQGVRVGIGNWEQQLENNKQAFALAFVQRTDFQAAYPNTLTADEFVTQLDKNAGKVCSPGEKANLMLMLGTTPADFSKRASVLRNMAEDSELRAAEFNNAFVLMQYFGYLRRNPNDAPDLDFSGYNFWLNKLNSFGGNFVNAEMVKAFIVSGEYRQRFGP